MGHPNKRASAAHSHPRRIKHSVKNDSIVDKAGA